MILLSILIPTLPQRLDQLCALVSDLERQLLSADIFHKVEILYDNTPPPVSTGVKRNNLLRRASGDYVWFIDDDDEICDGALHAVFLACASGCDVIEIDGYMTTNGGSRVDWEIRLGHPYIATERVGSPFYLRFPNHITPMRRECALAASFPDKTVFEDYDWACKIRDLGVLKTAARVSGFTYHYKHISNK